MSQLFVPSSPPAPQPETFSQSTPSHFSFTASTTHVSHLAEVLSAITAIDRNALMILTQYGITIYADYNHIINSQVTIDASLFSTFNYRWTGASGESQSQDVPSQVSLGFDVGLLSDAFTAAAPVAVPKSRQAQKQAVPDSVTCYLRYDGDGTPLVVEFEDALMSEQLEFSTFALNTDHVNEHGELDLESVGNGLSLDHSAVRFEAILQSDILFNLLQDLQKLSTQDLYLSVSNQSHGRSVEFVSRGTIGYSKLVYPNTPMTLQKLEIYQQDEIEPIPTKGTEVSLLKFAPFIRIARAVSLSSKCKLLKDFNGVLSIQLLCKHVPSKNYPGTLITYNTLEKAGAVDVGEPQAPEIDVIFDNKVYDHVKEYRAPPAKSPGEHSGFSYASLRTAAVSEEPAPTYQRNDEDFSTAGGPVEIPIFL